jgi:hypothetical protein
MVIFAARCWISLPVEFNGPFSREPPLGDDILKLARRIADSFDDPERDISYVARIGS